MSCLFAVLSSLVTLFVITEAKLHPPPTLDSTASSDVEPELLLELTAPQQFSYSLQQDFCKQVLEMGGDETKDWWIFHWPEMDTLRQALCSENWFSPEQWKL